MTKKNQSLSRIYCGLYVGILLSTLCGIANAQATRVSVNSANVQANRGASTSSSPSISANGRFVAFGSTSTNLVPGGVKDAEAVYFHDRLTHKTSRVSVSSSGVAGPGMFPSMSADGRYVVFESWVDTLAKGDANNMNDVLIHDNATHTTSLVSVSSKGVQGNNSSNKASISANGRFVVFESFADNLVPGDTNGVSDIFVRDLKAKTTTRVSVSSSGRQGDQYSGAGLATISGDGRFVAFTSLSKTLVANDKNKGWDAFVHDNLSKMTINLTSNLLPLGGADSKISANGQFVVFLGVVNPDTPEAAGMTLIYNVFNGQITPAIAEVPGLSLAGGNPSISGDGHFLAFEAVTPDNLSNIFIQDQVTNATYLVSANAKGVRGKNHSLLPTMSTDGHHVAYLSMANNLVPGDSNRAVDVFVLDF